MSELQLGLLVAGAIVVIGVFFHNKWQERRARRVADRAWRKEHPDVLMPPGGGSEDESTIDAAEPQSSQTASTQLRSGLGDAPPSAETASIDYSLSLPLKPPRSGQRVIAAAVRALGAAPKSTQLEGLAAGSDSWEPIRHSETYVAIRAGLQLVDRRGCVTHEDLRVFSSNVAQLATALDSVSSPGDTESALKAAQSLDRFCADVDIQVVVHIIGNDLSGTKIRAIAEENGFACDEDGRFRKRDREGRVLFCIANDEPAPFHADAMRTLITSSISLDLDVPRAPAGAEIFSQFRGVAQQLTSTLGGEIVDDRRNRLTAQTFDRIGVELESVWSMMHVRGIPAGSPLALRLFS